MGTVNGSAFVSPGEGKSRQGTVSVPLASILSALGITDPTTLKKTDLIIESDIILTDGSTVPASAIVNNGLFGSAIFFPAQVLGYSAEETKDFVPTATLKTASGLALKGGAKDTIKISYDQKITNTPTVTAGAGVILDGPVVADGSSGKSFYQLITADVGTTGAVTVTVSGASSSDFGVPLVQDDKKLTVNVDDTAPQVASTSTGSFIARGGLVTISATFNETMSAKSADGIKVTITGNNLEDVTDAPMTLSTDGKTFSYTYLFKEAAGMTATPGAMTITFTGGKDQAGNDLAAGALNTAIGSLVCDVGTPPAPTMMLDAGGHDLGVQIKWNATANAATGPGIRSGKVYWVAVDNGDPAPTDFSVDNDGVATWTVAGATSTQAFAAALTTGSDGTSGTVFSAFAPNGTFDIYAVFVSNSGTISDISATPQLTAVVMN